jgi:hypothetical protein
LSDRREIPSPLHASSKDDRFYNIARRSFLSYRLALPGASYAEVSNEAGNNEAILRKYYRRKVTRQEAVQYFGLRSNKV